MNVSSLQVINLEFPVVSEQNHHNQISLFVCLFVCDGRPSEAKGSLNWDIPTSGGWRLVMPPTQVKPGVQT